MQGPDDCAHYGASKAVVEVDNEDGQKFLSCYFCYCITCNSIILEPDKEIEHVVVLNQGEDAVFVKVRYKPKHEAIWKDEHGQLRSLPDLGPG